VTTKRFIVTEIDQSIFKKPWKDRRGDPFLGGRVCITSGSRRRELRRGNTIIKLKQRES